MDKNSIPLKSSICNYELYTLSKVLSVSTGSYNDNQSKNIINSKWSGIKPKYDDTFSIVSSQSSQNDIKDTNDEKVSSSSSKVPLNMDDISSIQPDLSVFENIKPVHFKQIVICSKKTFHLMVCLLSNNVLIFRLIKIKDEVEEGEGEGEERIEKKYMEMNEKKNEIINCIVKCENYFQERKIKITNMSVCKSNGKWCSVFSEKGEIFIIPIYKIIFPVLCKNLDNWPFSIKRGAGHRLLSKNEIDIKASKMNKFPLLSSLLADSGNKNKNFNFVRDHLNNTITQVIRKNSIFHLEDHGFITCSTWWKTYEDHYYIIFGTDKGSIVILNLKTLVEECLINTGSRCGIKKLSIVKDFQNFLRYLLIYSKNGKFHKLVLEQEDLELGTCSTIIQHYKKVKNDDKSTKTFQLKSFVSLNKEYPCKVSVYKNRKRTMLSSFSKKTNQVSIFNPDDCRFPMFLFQLNENSSIVYMSEKLIFTIQKNHKLEEEKQGEKLWIVSKILSSELNLLEDWKLKKSVKKNFTVFQEFNFISNQRVLGFLQGIKLKSTQTIPGCYIYTQDTIYELKSKNSPQKIFNYLLSKFNNNKYITDQFGKTFNLNLYEFYEKSADIEFEKGNYETAFDLYNLSNITDTKMVEKLKKTNKYDEILKYLSEKLDNPRSLKKSKRSELSNLLFQCYVHKIMYLNYEDIKRFCDHENNYSGNETFDKDDFKNWNLANIKESSNELLKRFRKFLFEKNYYNSKNVIRVLINLNFVSLSIEVGYLNNIIEYTLLELLKQGIIRLEEKVLDFLINFNLSTVLYEIGNGIFLNNTSIYKRIKCYLSFLKNKRELKIEYQRARKEREKDFKAFKNEIIFVVDPKISKELRKIVLLVSHKNKKDFAESKECLLNILTFFDLESTILLELEKQQLNKKSYKELEEYNYYPGIGICSHIEIFIICLLNYLKFSDTDDTYNKKLLKNYLVYCSHFYQKSYVLKKCLKYDNIKAVELIYKINNCWLDALDCNLLYVKKNLSDKNLKEKKLLKTFRVYILERNLGGVKKILIEKILKFWKSENIKNEELEKLCLENLCFIGGYLCEIFLDKNDFYLNFSVEFYLQITEFYIRGLKKYDEDENKSILNLELQILKNMKQDIFPKHEYITLKLTDLKKTVKMNENNTTEFLFFTCRHKFEKNDFYTNILNFFKKKLEKLSNSQLNKFKNQIAFYIIKEKYKRRFITQACPICVFNYFKQIN